MPMVGSSAPDGIQHADMATILDSRCHPLQNTDDRGPSRWGIDCRSAPESRPNSAGINPRHPHPSVAAPPGAMKLQRLWSISRISGSSSIKKTDSPWPVATGGLPRRVETGPVSAAGR